MSMSRLSASMMRKTAVGVIAGSVLLLGMASVNLGTSAGAQSNDATTQCGGWETVVVTTDQAGKVHRSTSCSSTARCRVRGKEPSPSRSGGTAQDDGSHELDWAVQELVQPLRSVPAKVADFPSSQR